MEGTHWSCETESLGNGRWLCVLACRERPEFNHYDIHTEGEEVEVDKPFYGGRATVRCDAPDPDTFVLTTRTDRYGTFHVTESYCEAGLCIAVRVEDKAGNVVVTSNEWWPRAIEEEGCFAYEGHENAEEYFKAMGMYANLFLSVQKLHNLRCRCQGEHGQGNGGRQGRVVQTWRGPLEAEGDLLRPGARLRNKVRARTQRSITGLAKPSY